MDDVADLVDVALRGRRPPHHRRRGDRAALQLQVTRGAVADRVDLVVVDAGQDVDDLGHLEDLGQGLLIEDRSVLDLDHDRDVVRAAELVGEPGVHLHERMPVRQQVAELGEHLDAEREEQHHRGECVGHERHRLAVVDQPHAETVEGGLFLMDD